MKQYPDKVMQKLSEALKRRGLLVKPFFRSDGPRSGKRVKRLMMGDDTP